MVPHAVININLNPVPFNVQLLLCCIADKHGSDSLTTYGAPLGSHYIAVPQKP